MARELYSLVNKDGLTGAADPVNAIEVLNLITKELMYKVLLSGTSYPVNATPSQGQGIFAGRSSDGFIYATQNRDGAPLAWIYKITIATGVIVDIVSIGLPSLYISAVPKGIYIDNTYIYILTGFWSVADPHIPFIRQYLRSDYSFVADLQFDIASFEEELCGLANDGVNWWSVRNDTKKIQKRALTSPTTVVIEYAFPIGFATAIFYSCQIDSQNSTHLWLQGVNGSNGVIVVWDISSQTIISEWSTTDVLRMNKQFAIGGASGSGAASLDLFEITFPVGGNVVLGYKLTDEDAGLWNVTLAQYSLNAGVDWNTATMGTDGDGYTNIQGSVLGSIHSWAWNRLTDLGPVGRTGIQFKLGLTRV